MSDTMLYVVCFGEVGGCRGVWKGLGVTSFLQGGDKNLQTKMDFYFFAFLLIMIVVWVFLCFGWLCFLSTIRVWLLLS